MKIRLRNPVAIWGPIYTIKSGWILLGVLVAHGLYALFFVPMHYVLNGTEGIFQGLLVVLGGGLLGRWSGALVGMLIGGSSTLLWIQFYPTSLAATVFSTLLSGAVGYGCGAVGDFLRRARLQALDLRNINEALQQAEARVNQAEKLAFLGEMAASVSHELNQPLTIITMGAELALRSLPAGTQPQIEEDLRKILSQAKRAGQIIQHMKLLGRGNSAPGLEVHDLNGILHSSLNLVSDQLRLGEVVLRTELLEEGSPVMCDPIQLEMVFSNLLLNARDALEYSPKKEIVVTIRRLNGKFLAEVRDSGPGIPLGFLGNIFDPFFTTKEVGRGTGLGLAICHRIVQAHGGDLTVNSVEGQGAEFRIELPVAAGAGLAAGKDKKVLAG